MYLPIFMVWSFQVLDWFGNYSETNLVGSQYDPQREEKDISCKFYPIRHSNRHISILLMVFIDCSPVVLVTNTDRINPFEQSEVINKIRGHFENLNCARFFPVENYTYNKHQRLEETEIQILEMLFNCCLVADQFITKMLTSGKKGICC